MSKLISINKEGDIEFNNEFMLYKEFKIITGKKELQRLGKYLYLAYNPASELDKYNEAEKEKEALYQSDLTSSDIKKYKIQIEKYIKLISTPSLVAINTSKDALFTMTEMSKKVTETIRDRMNKEELSLQELSELQSMMKSSLDLTNKLPDTIAKLKDLQEKYKAEIAEEGDLIGGQQRGFIN